MANHGGPVDDFTGSKDHVQDGLDYISKKLAHPSFLRGISPSRLPSQAASEEPSPSWAAVTFPEPANRPSGDVTKLPPRNDSLFPDVDESVDTSPGRVVEQKAAGSTVHSIRTTTTRAAATQELSAVCPYKEPVSASALIRNLESFVGHFDIEHLVARSSASTRPAPLAMAQGSTTTSIAAPLAGSGQQQTSFQTFDHGHHDLVLAVDFDFYGNRMVTASSDHRLKVWDKDSATDRWSVTDTWRAHDAEIVDVRFNGPFTTPSLASIAEDSKLHVWAEDVLQPRNSGHRFRRINTLNSETAIPFSSLAFKNLMSETYLATITRDGYLAIYEPVNSDDLSSDWGRIHGEPVCPTPDRSQETSFSVSWHNESVPCWTAVEAGLDRRSLGLAVAAMGTVRIFRTDRDRKFHPVIELTGARNIIRDVAWANGSMRGYDLIAAASKDGTVRIYEVSVPKARSGSDPAVMKPRDINVPTILEPDSNGGDSSNGNSPAASGNALAQRNNRSALSSNLARAATSSALSTSSTDLASTPNQQFANMPPAPGIPRHEAKLVGEVGKEHGGVWRLAWSFAGDLLMTTGDDGSVRAWKKTIDGKWVEAASLDIEGG